MAKIEAGHTYTDAELLAIWREAYAKISVHGQSYTSPSGRTFEAADLGEIAAQIDRLEAKVNSASGGPAFTKVNRRRAT